MNRIEYLINNPNEIDVIDLDLLNNEIEKYPYFYSLRALKLLALKKSNNQDFEKQLEITSSFNNTKNLFNLLNPSENNESIIENNTEEEIIEVEKVIEESETISETTQLIDEEIIIDQAIEEVIEDDNSVQEILIDETAIEESIEKSIEITKDFLQTDEIIIAAVEQTIDVLQETDVLEEINQVELVNRNLEIEKEITTKENLPISSLTPFQILNTKDEVIRSRETKIKEISIQENIEEIINESKPVEEEINNEATFKEIEIEKVIDEPKVIDEQNQIIEEKIIESKPIEEIKEEVTLKTEETNSYSFNEWLQQPTSNSSDSLKEHKYQVIEDFLEKNPKLTPLKKQEIPEYKNEVKDLKQTDFSDLMTETLAQIYIEQKQYEKAIKAYKILILKYPEKNSLFANQIKEIENLKNSK